MTVPRSPSGTVAPLELTVEEWELIWESLSRSLQHLPGQAPQRVPLAALLVRVREQVRILHTSASTEVGTP